MTRKYIPEGCEKAAKKKKVHEKYDSEIESEFLEILERFNQRSAEVKRKSVIFPTAAPKNHTKIIPGTENYQFPALTENEQKRYDELKKIVTDIEKNISKSSATVSGTIEDFYRTQLNDMQCEAVFTLDGPVLVIAGAGSGKTRTVVHRVSYMLQKGIDPASILLLTFTRKASEEMISRVNQLTGAETARRITAGTFHSFANMMLRIYGTNIGISPNFTICDTVDSEDIIDLIKNENEFQKRNRPFPQKGTVVEMISRSRNTGTSIGEVLDSQYPKYLDFTDDIKLISIKYDEFKKGRNILDYDDLLERFLDLLENTPAVRAKIQSRYKFVMVDEYQDTNTFQGRIADIISEKHRNIMVVGDDLQSIYAFRGANFENILRFPQKWPDCRIIKLEQNYRSKRELLDFTNSIIGNCYAAYNKSLFSMSEGAVKPIIKRASDAQNEAVFVADMIEHELLRVKPYEISVLYRSGFHGSFVQAELLKRNIDFAVYGGIKFIERRHIKDMLSYAKVIQNPSDTVALNRILKLLPGIGTGTSGKIIAAVTTGGFREIGSFSKKKYFNDIKKLFEMLFKSGEVGRSVASILNEVSNYYIPVLQEIETDYEERVRDISVLLQIAGTYKSLEKFLTDFALDPPENRLNKDNGPVENDDEFGKVVLSTIHSAKGLEWHTVFVVHLLDGCFPSDRSLSKIDDLEEERRLFYVACSRAKEKLVLTFPASLSFYGGSLSMPSRFLAEIKEEFYEIS